MKFKKLLLSFLVGSLLIPSSGDLAPVSAAVSLSNLTLASPERLLETSASDGTGLIRSMLDRTKQIKAYSLDTVLNTFKGNKQITETGRLFFKNPNLVRFEVISAGKRSGAVVVRQLDGKIKGKMGGALGGIKITLSSDSKLLKTANDFSVLECDLGSLLEMTIGKLDSKSQCLSGNLPGIPNQIVELVDGNGLLVSRMTVDARNKLPEEWGLFKENKLFSSVKFANVKIVADLPDSTFTLEGPGKEEETLIAHQRGIGMPLAEYRLQLDSIRLQEQSELIASELEDLRRGGMQAAKMSLVAKALSTISAETNAIAEIKLEVEDSSSSWADGSKERLVIAASQIELLLSSIELAADSQEGNGAVDNLENGKHARHEAILACKRTIASLIEQTDLDQPDVVLFKGLQSELKKNTGIVIDMFLSL